MITCKECKYWKEMWDWGMCSNGKVIADIDIADDFGREIEFKIIDTHEDFGCIKGEKE